MHYRINTRLPQAYLKRVEQRRKWLQRRRRLNRWLLWWLPFLFSLYAGPAFPQADLARADSAASTFVAGRWGSVVLGVTNVGAATLCNADGRFCTFTFDATGALRISGSISGGGDGAILDGVTASIRATVFDYVNSNPFAVRLTDTNGDYVSVGGGTQYNQGTASTATDTLTMAGAVRHDTASVDPGVVDGDRLVFSTDALGRLRTTSVDTTQPVSGTFWQATQPVSGTFWQATQPVSFSTIDGGTFGAGTSPFALIGGEVDEVSPATLAEGQFGAVRMTPARSIYIESGFDDNEIFTGDSSPVMPNGALYDTTPPAVTDGHLAAFRMNSARVLFADLSLTGSNATPLNVSVSSAAVAGTTAHDSPGASVNPVAIGGYASAAAPTDVTADTDIVRTWHLRNGSPVVNLASGGTLLTSTGTSLNINCTGGCTPGGSFADSSAFTFGTTAVSNTAFVVDDTATNTVAENSAGAARMNTNRILYTMNTNSTGTEVGTSGAPLRVDPTGTTTQPISGSLTNISGTISLPTGASTLSEQQTQTTALQLIDNLPLAQASTTSGQSGVLDQGAVTTSAPTYTTGQTDPLSLQTDGSLRTAVTNTVTVSDGAGAMNVIVDSITEQAIGVEDAGETAGGNLKMAGTVRRDTAASSAGATGDNATLNTDVSGLLWARDADPCSGTGKTPAVVNISTATTTQLVAASASNKVYVCSLNLVTAAANNVALVEDDTAACASPTAGMAGGTTAATGWNFAANGGIAFGNGASSLFVTAAINRYVCLISSAATQLSGSIMYVLAP